MTRDALQQAREAYAHHDWVRARAAYQDTGSPDPEDVYAHANCCWWLGDLAAAIPLLGDAHRGFRAAGRPGRAAMVALDVGYTHLLRGEEAPGLGWLSRAHADAQEVPDGVEHGYLAHVDVEAAFATGDLDAAETAIDRVQAIALQHQDATLAALAMTLRGRVLLRRARVRDGVALLDRAMVAAVSDVSDPGWAGNIYCHLMAACVEVSDLRRAAEWTEQTARWCTSMPGAGPFLGICRVHRAQILHLRGRWAEAEQEARTVCDELRHFAVDTVAEAHCLQGDLRRLRGDLAGAAEAYAAARALGREPLPGTALLTLARGDAPAAVVTLRQAVDATPVADAPARARLLPALVEAALACRDVPTAEGATAELEGLADAFDTIGLRCAAATARAAVLLATGRPAEARQALQVAVRGWSALEAPYELARALQLCADAWDAVGDRARGRLDRQAARTALTRLGLVDAAAPPVGTLTPRERQVLGLVAAGHSNQEIAATLVLSVRTVERHLDSIYRKLGVQGRAARVAAARCMPAEAGDAAPDLSGQLGVGTHPAAATRS
jgi:DNA-binding NarL/FixJ family response regulator